MEKATHALPASPASSSRQSGNLWPKAGDQLESKPQCRPAALKQIVTLPLSFEPNRGQSDSAVKFLSHFGSDSLLLTPGGAVLVLSGDGKPIAQNIQEHQSRPPRQQSVLRMNLLAANPASSFTGADELPGKVNYYLGRDSSKWLTGISLYRRVVVHEAVKHLFIGP